MGCSFSGHPLRPDDLVERRLFHAEALFEALERPADERPVRLLRWSWLRARAKMLLDAPTEGDRRLLALQRRQELPEEAFIGAAELRRIYRRRCPAQRVPIAAVSYCWQTPEHPDPAGNVLVMLAAAINAVLKIKTDKKSINKFGHNLYRNFPDELGIFYDYCSLHQRPLGGGERSERETRLFQEALGSLELWYAHRLTTVFRARLALGPRQRRVHAAPRPPQLGCRTQRCAHRLAAAITPEFAD